MSQRSGSSISGSKGKTREIDCDSILAAKIGDVEWLDQALSDGRNLHAMDKQGLSPTHLAAMNGKLDCLQLLIEKYFIDVNTKSIVGWTPLHLAINNEIGPNAKKCINYLLKQGANVHIKNNEKTSCVHKAACEGNISLLKIILKHYTESLEDEDHDGKTPHFLAKLWGRKDCARLIENEIWKRRLIRNQEEEKRVKQLKAAYKNLQKEALLQLRNEQDFYGNVTHTNWMEDKGIDIEQMMLNMYQKERHEEEAIDGLAKRILVSGDVDDCAARMEKLSNKFSARPKKSKPVNSMQESSAKQTAKTKPAVLLPTIENYQRKKLDTNVSRRGTKDDWNYSTNVNSPPTVDIKYPNNVSIGIQPSIRFQFVLPPASVLPTIRSDYSSTNSCSESSAPTTMVLPGGRVENTDISFKSWSPEKIRKLFCSDEFQRMLMPEEFRAVNIIDVKHKRFPPTLPDSEIKWHLNGVNAPEVLTSSSDNN